MCDPSTKPFPKALAKRIRAAHEAAERERRFAEWRFERAEARACGYEFPSFEEWLGKASAKQRAETRFMARERREILDEVME